jgi:uncharacterized protein YqeY
VTLFEQINNDIKEAMRAKDELKLSVLRMMKSKVLYVNARGDLPEADVTKIVNKYGKDIRETIEEYTKVGRAAEVATAEKELAIVQSYLPKELTPDELKTLVRQAIAETGASAGKQMGLVMKAMQAKAPGADGKVVSQLVRELLPQ